MSPFRALAMPWLNMYDADKHRTYHPISVRKAGFAGLVGDQDWEDEVRESRGQSHEHEFDEDLWDSTTPEPTTHEQRHYEEHGEYPDEEDHHYRHEMAYSEALDRKRDEDRLDHDDPALMGFVREHGANTQLWHEHGRVGKVSLRQPIYATQSHVAEEHIHRYLADPHGISHHRRIFGAGAGGDYLGEDHPMFVTHEGRVHATEGHHRIAAALRRGDKDIYAAHFNLDEHPQFEHGEGNEDDEY